jgi:phospholipid-binding lipoprotein MlaA
MNPTPLFFFHRAGLLILFLFSASPCFAGTLPVESTPAADGVEQDTYDPLERMNRAVYKFNDRFDRALLKPVAKGYDFITPNPVQHSIRSFFSNLLSPTVVLNDLLQAKFRQSAADTGRFLVNSTVGIAGLFDVAKHIGLKPHDEDFGQTLGAWGVGEGPYLVWPILGPKNLRDSAGWLGDFATNPVTYVNDPADRWGLWAVNLVDTRASLLGVSDVLQQAAGDDEYLFVREAYRQRRINLIYDGNPPKPKPTFFDDDLVVEPPPATP